MGGETLRVIETRPLSMVFRGLIVGSENIHHHIIFNT